MKTRIRIEKTIECERFYPEYLFSSVYFFKMWLSIGLSSYDNINAAKMKIDEFIDETNRNKVIKKTYLKYP